MSEATPLQDWLREIGERSLFTVRSHVAAETSTDTDQILATVSQDVFFAVPHRTRAGNVIPPGTVLTSYAEVRDYYAGRADTYVVLDSRQLKSTASDWYVFNESAATLRGTGPIGDVDAAGREFVVNSAILFPTAEDGIRGEICVTRHPFDDVVGGSAPALPALDASFPEREHRHAVLLDELLFAVRSRNDDALGELLCESQCVAIRLDVLAPDAGVESRIVTGSTRDEARSAFAGIFGSMRDVALVTRLTTDWYAFAEYVGRLADGATRRFAAIHPIEDGRVTGTFGYGLDEIGPV